MKKSFFAALLAVLMVGSMLPAQAFAATWVDVSTWDQLKAAVADSTTTNIRLAADIEFPNKEAVINTCKPALVIDGNGHTITDANAACLTYTLHYNKRGNLKNITVQNANIVGRNCYGMIAIDDCSTYSDVTVTFANVNYSGPGLSWGKYSNFVLQDSSVSVVPSKVSAASEIFDCNTVRLVGNINITKNAPSSANELFEICHDNGGVTIASGANVNVSNNQNGGKCNSDRSGFVEYGCSKIYFVCEDSSNFTYVGNNCFQDGSAVDTVYIGKAASCKITLNGALEADAAFQVRGNMLIDQCATFDVIVLKNCEDEPLIQLVGTGKCTFNSPADVLIYNSSTNKCNTGLALGPYGCTVSVTYSNVGEVSYWKLNCAAPNALPKPTYTWTNGGGLFGLCETLVGDDVLKASSNGYTGVTPWNKTTASMEDINVIHIGGCLPVA